MVTEEYQAIRCNVDSLYISAWLKSAAAWLHALESRWMERLIAADESPGLIQHRKLHDNIQLCIIKYFMINNRCDEMTHYPFKAGRVA